MAWLHVVIRALEADGHDGARMAIDAGIPPRSIRHPDGRVPQVAMTRLWKAAVKTTRNPCFGLEVARFVTPSTFGALNHVAFVSPTLEDAFHRVVRFQRLMTDAMRLELVRADDRYRLRIRPIAPDHPPAEELDAFWATWVRVTRAMASGESRAEPRRIHRRRPRPRDTALFKKVFRAPMRFGAQEDFVEYDYDDCRRPLSDANLTLAEEYEQILARQAASLDDATVAEKVRALLFEIMADGPTELAVATRLHMSTSLLKLSLARESTSYRAILEDVRETLARRYLGERAYSIKETSFLLGYADASTFTRAFKRWTGETPRDYAAKAT